MLHSPLIEHPRNQQAIVIPTKQKSSMLDWLQNSGRLIAPDDNNSTFSRLEVEISDFSLGEEGIGDFNYDDSNISLDED